MVFCAGVLFVTTITVNAANLPTGFVYLKDIDPSILQDIRYASYHNFIGYPLKGYRAAECVLTEKTAKVLSEIQKELKSHALSLKVYDCYRPQMTVDQFKQWSLTSQQEMRAEFYPRVPKKYFFQKGYVSARSGHSRGSTIDLTLVPIPTPPQTEYRPGQKLFACTADYLQRFRDNSIDMGTGYDCFDMLAHPYNQNISATAYQNRMLLRNMMFKHGFKGILTEWWHFTLIDEPYRHIYFNFLVTSRS
jgi:D-alanyl-D-alanine dipeptidase